MTTMTDSRRSRSSGGMSAVVVTVIATAVASMAVAGCGSPTDSLDEPFVGELGFPDRLSVEIPDTVDAGTPFTVTFETRGANSCYAASRTDVDVDDRTATVTPWDVRTGDACFSMGSPLPHSASITFDRSGPGLVQVVGRDGVVRRLVVIR